MTKKIIHLLFLLVLTSCAKLVREAPLERASLPRLNVDAFQGVEVASIDREEMLEKLFTPQPGMTACSFLDDLSIAKTYLPGSRFRLVGEMRVGLAPRDAQGKKLNKKSCFQQCLPFFWGSGACKRCKEEREKDTEIFSLDGRVDISASPLYQYALLTQEIPNRKRFLELVEEEIDKQSLLATPIARLYKWLLGANIIDLYAKRNEIIQDRVNEAFPGSFDPAGLNRSLKKSFPEAVLRNGMPTFSNLSPLPDDAREVRDRKSRELKAILAAYSKSVPVFSLSGKWSSFQDEMERGMNLALQAFNTQSPKEQACATAILHRGFAQLLTIAGYDRPPMAVDDPAKEVSAFPTIDRLLENPQGTRFKVCPMAGAFGKDGYRMTLYAKDLENFDAAKDTLLLTRNTPNSASCAQTEAVATNSWEYTHYNRPRLSEVASGEDLLNFAHGISHWLVSFNPGAKWWTQETNVTGFPLANFDSLSSISTSGGILPVQGHALSLALVNVTFAQIMKNHLVMLDEFGKETTDAKKAIFVRYSDRSREAGSGGKITTTLRSAILALETTLKFQASFENLSKWKADSKARLDADMASERDLKKREEMAKEYAAFVKGMFGGDDTFAMVTDKFSDAEIKAGQAPSLRNQLVNVELALAMLSANFAKKNADGTFTCYNQLVKDFDSKDAPEEKIGQCSVEDQRRWKRLMSMVASMYKSPLFAKYAAKN